MSLHPVSVAPPHSLAPAFVEMPITHAPIE
jgi:hypothetical protein